MPTIKQVETILTNAQKVLGSPAAVAILNALRPLLPKWGITAADAAGLDARYADAAARKAKAKKRAGL